MKEKIIQFGTGNFLRAFADSFIDSLNKQGLFDGSVVIVSPTDSKNVEKLNETRCRYGLLLRGIQNGELSSRYSEITCVSRAINPYKDYGEFLALARQEELRFIISNTTESGIVFDATCKFADSPASSFPAKLTRFLYERYSSGLGGFIILPCELIDNNADELKRCVLRYAELWSLGADFMRWTENENVFANTLVDRIVTGFPTADAESIFRETGRVDKLLDVAEPYCLWVIEGYFEDELPLKRGGVNVIWTDNVAVYKKMKVRILNGSHTLLCFPSLLCGIETVSESLSDSLINEFLQKCLFGYILPTLGSGEENRIFAEAVLERFKNPYLHHKWSSISLNSVSKFRMRVLPTAGDIRAETGLVPRAFSFSLACLIKYYRELSPTDSEENISFMRENRVADILKNETMWGEDLSPLTSDVCESLTRIEKDGIREAIKWSISE